MSDKRLLKCRRELEYSPHGRFATQRKFERKCRTNVSKSADVEDSPHERFDHYPIDKLGKQNKTEYVGCLVGHNNARKSYHVEDWSRNMNFD